MTPTSRSGSDAAAPVTPLGYVLLCEIRVQPRGGYALRRLFETTPLGIFSSSPGSIYPALRGLETRGLIRAVGSGRGGRFELTDEGEVLLAAWLAQPVTVEEVSGRIELCLLRFAFLEGRSDAARSFLASFRSAAETRAAQLSGFLDSEAGRALTPHGRLAVRHGLAAMQTSARWAADALTEIGDASGAKT